jgi:hypothetical protein
MDSALMHACIAVRYDSKRLYPEEKGVGCVTQHPQYYWLIEP